MPDAALPKALHHISPPPTTANLDYANLAIIDLAKYNSPEGRAELVKEVREALSTVGFFYVINHGYTQEQTRRIFDIADIPFSQVSTEDKQKYVAAMKTDGSYQGYKPRQYWHIDAGVRDQLEDYNISLDVTKKQHPVELRPFLPEISEFAKHNHFNVLFPLLRLLALGLELPEETFVKQHDFNAPTETTIAFIKYYPRTEEDEVKTKNVWLKGHTDTGSITLLWSQPVAALQIMTPEKEWKWVRHIENALVVNTGDALEFLSGGFYKGTIHRVVQPPPDQRGLTRLGVFYFALTNDDVKLVPAMESPVLQKVDIVRRCDDSVAPMMEVWRKGRISTYGQSILQPQDQRGVQEELINGLVVRHYN
ncbi:hypothetical protein BD779DRAFT_474689 [Infundibulicybe gibba]|nr:hypothetical protein BD779DRAFT_474689 [Infundibulicybe gibba]